MQCQIQVTFIACVLRLREQLFLAGDVRVCAFARAGTAAAAAPVLSEGKTPMGVLLEPARRD